LALCYNKKEKPPAGKRRRNHSLNQTEIAAFLAAQTACGFQAAALPMQAVSFDPSLRESCKQNACGAYGANYSCPPFCGAIEALIAAVQQYQTLLLFSKFYPLTDSFDIEGMNQAQCDFQQDFRKLVKDAHLAFPLEAMLPLAAGGCRQCPTCGAKAGFPCPHPETAFCSLESHGIFVSQTAQSAGLPYLHGRNTVTYFAGLAVGR
jgi:predicted metal-binding protein